MSTETQLQLLKLDFAPGFHRESTQYSEQGKWFDGNRVRFREGKPENMLENIAKGKLKKFFKENTLINQAYIKDNKISVINYLHSINKNCSISDLARIRLTSCMCNASSAE